MGVSLYNFLRIAIAEGFSRASFCGKIAAVLQKLVVGYELFVVKLLDLKYSQVEILTLSRRISCPESGAIT
jgi:hypothetical protein